MANAVHDSNFTETLIAASNADGVTPVKIMADPSTHSLLVQNGILGSDNGRPDATRDSNFVPVLMAVSSVDGVTPVEVYGDPATGELLVQSM